MSSKIADNIGSQLLSLCMPRRTKQILKIENQFSIFLMENKIGNISKSRMLTVFSILVTRLFKCMLKTLFETVEVSGRVGN